jgi:cell division protein FtsI (penicillin-binding protein 3)
MDVKNEVLYRVYGLLFGIVLPIAIVLIYKTVDISYWNGERWREKGKDQYMDFRPVEAERGNILAVDGSLLATSIPFFDIYMDPNSTGMSEEDFMENLDTLAWCIAQHIDNTFTPGGFREYLLQQRQDKQRYLPIKRKASYAEKRFIEQFPLFNLGQMRGGFIAQKRSERKRPFGVLAQRTIGYVRDDAKPIGLEGYFDRDLGGHQGQQLMICVDRPNDIWIPVHDLMQVEPRSGDDIVTTLDINLQDVVHNALLRALNYHDAEWGTAVLMETQTGAIRAIANLGRIDNGWWETFNYAVGYPIEPGSTFKLASIMALLEDKYIDLDDTIAIDRGRATFYDEEMNDSSPYTARMDTASVRDIFRYSSNVGMAKLVSKYYGKKEKRNGDEGAARFVRRLKDFHLNLPTGIEIEGEVNPYIKEAYNTQDQWSGTTLPWMSIGYEVKMTPLQLLTFYNAVANNGALVKPYLVSEVLRFGEPIRSYKPTILKKSIAERTTIRKAQTLLESVVEEGTAYKLRTERFRIAGKTGTTQVNYRRGQRGRSVGGYQASFV